MVIGIEFGEMSIRFVMFNLCDFEIVEVILCFMKFSCFVVLLLDLFFFLSLIMVISFLVLCLEIVIVV